MHKMYTSDKTKWKRKEILRVERLDKKSVFRLLQVNCRSKNYLMTILIARESEGLLISTFKSAFQGSEPKKTKLKMKEMLEPKDSNCLQLFKRRQGRKIALLMTQRVCCGDKKRKRLNRKNQLEVLNRNLL